jgi:uncharacterized protein
LRIVLDANVLVSGLLSPFGTPAEVLRLVSSGVIGICLDGRIEAEYREVLARPTFGFDGGLVDDLLDYFASAGEMVSAIPLAHRLPDADDEPFLEVAVAASADCLVTGNLAHFPPQSRAGAVVLSPADMIERFRAELAEPEAVGFDHDEERL